MERRLQHAGEIEDSDSWRPNISPQPEPGRRYTDRVRFTSCPAALAARPENKEKLRLERQGLPNWAATPPPSVPVFPIKGSILRKGERESEREEMVKFSYCSLQEIHASWRCLAEAGFPGTL